MTIAKLHNKSYVYIHKRKDTGLPFYIGIGCKPSLFRAYEKAKRNKHWKAIVNKHGFEVEVYAEGITWARACEIENELILKLGRQDKGTGPLINLTDGGEGSAGAVVSPETKAKITKAKTGTKRESPSIETRKKQSDARKGIRPKNFDYLHSDEVVKRRISALKGSKTPETINTLIARFTGATNPRARLLLDAGYGIFYDNMKDAQNAYGKKMSHSFWSMMLSGKRKNSTNFKFV